MNFFMGHIQVQARWGIWQMKEWALKRERAECQKRKRIEGRGRDEQKEKREWPAASSRLVTAQSREHFLFDGQLYRKCRMGNEKHEISANDGHNKIIVKIVLFY